MNVVLDCEKSMLFLSSQRKNPLLILLLLNILMFILYICILVVLIYIMAQLSLFFSGSMRSDAIFKTGLIKHY